MRDANGPEKKSRDTHRTAPDDEPVNTVLPSAEAQRHRTPPSSGREVHARGAIHPLAMSSEVTLSRPSAPAECISTTLLPPLAARDGGKARAHRRQVTPPTCVSFSAPAACPVALLNARTCPSAPPLSSQLGRGGASRLCSRGAAPCRGGAKHTADARLACAWGSKCTQRCCRSSHSCRLPLAQPTKSF